MSPTALHTFTRKVASSRRTLGSVQLTTDLVPVRNRKPGFHLYTRFTTGSRPSCTATTQSCNLSRCATLASPRCRCYSTF
jgi:hypothetical protein